MRTFLIVIVLAIVLSSCSNSDDTNQPQERSTQELLIGKWFVKTTSVDIAAECAEQTFYEFIDNQHLNHKFVGQQLAIDLTFLGCVPILSGEYTYTLSADNSFSFDTEDLGLQAFKIVTISETDLVLTQQIGSEVSIILLEK